MTDTHSRQLTASDVEQPDKYDELNEPLLYSSPHLEHGPAHPGIDGRPAPERDEPVTDRHGQELQSSRRREWNASNDAAYTGGSVGPDGHYADVGAMDGQDAADRIDADAGELLTTASGTTGRYWFGALTERAEPLPSVPAPFPGGVSDEAPGEQPTGPRERFPLATEERIEGEHAELLRQREKAHAAAEAGIARASRCRTEVAERHRQCRPDIRPRLVPSDGSERPDPRETLTQSELASVNQAAARLTDELVGTPSTAALAGIIARKVSRGSGIPEAVFATRDQWRRWETPAQAIDTVDPWEYEVTVQGTVTTLYDPAAVSQKQVGLIEDPSGEAKVTIWEKSGRKPLLREGDEVRLYHAKPGEYNGQTTVAVVAETRVVILERGDGPAITRHSSGTDSATAADQSSEQTHGACTLPAPGEGQTVSRSTHVPRERRDVPVEQPDAVTKDKVGKDSLTAGAWLKTDVVYPAVAVVPRFSKADVRRRRAARASDDPNRSASAAQFEPVGYSVIRLPFPEWWTERDDVEAVGPQAGDRDAEDASEGAPDGESDLRDRTPAAYRLHRSFENDAGDDDEDGCGTGDAGDVDGSSDSSEPDVEQSGEETAGSLAAADGGEAVPGPTTSVRCPQCGHDRAAYQLQQTRAADEAPTRLYTCIGCSHRWREDD